MWPILDRTVWEASSYWAQAGEGSVLQSIEYYASYRYRLAADSGFPRFPIPVVFFWKSLCAKGFYSWGFNAVGMCVMMLPSQETGSENYRALLRRYLQSYTLGLLFLDHLWNIDHSALKGLASVPRQIRLCCQEARDVWADTGRVTHQSWSLLSFQSPKLCKSDIIPMCYIWPGSLEEEDGAGKHELLFHGPYPYNLSNRTLLGPSDWGYPGHDLSWFDLNLGAYISTSLTPSTLFYLCYHLWEWK